jgi:hypothetical protein
MPAERKLLYLRHIFDHLRQLTVLFNENDREIEQKRVSTVDYSILEQPPDNCHINAINFICTNH